MTSPRQLSNEVIASTLARFEVTVTPDQIRAIREYIDLLLLWNQKISLTSITDPLAILSRHFGESMFAAHAIPDLHGRLADVGSGPGFPGLALKIIRPDLEVFVIESVIKKSTFLAEVSRHLNLTGVKVVVSRFEDLADDLAPLDFICARALGDRDSFLQWAIPNLNIDGRVVLWLGSEALSMSTPAVNTPPPPDSGSSSETPSTMLVAADFDDGATVGHHATGPASASSSVGPPSTTSATAGGLARIGGDPATPAPTRVVRAVSRTSTWRWASPIQIPDSANRYLLVGKPHNQ